MDVLAVRGEPAGSDKRALAVDRGEAPLGGQGNDLIHVLLGEDGGLNEENVDATRDSLVKGGDKSALLRERQFVLLKPQRRSRCSILLLPADTARLRHESGVADPSSPARSKDSIRQDSQPRRAVCPSRFLLNGRRGIP